MGSYYYAVATLPYLRLDSDRHPSLEEFHELCERWCPAEDLKIILDSALENVSLESDEVHPIVLKYYRWEAGLRNELIRQRAQKLQRDAQAMIQTTESGDDFSARSGLSEAVRTIMSAPNALAADEALDAIRWEYLSELEVGQYFNLEQMLVYYIRLQILVRRNSLTIEAGAESYTAHYEAVREQMNTTQKFDGEQV